MTEITDEPQICMKDGLADSDFIVGMAGFDFIYPITDYETAYVNGHIQHFSISVSLISTHAVVNAEGC